MTTHQSGVLLLIICSGLALIWSAQSQLIRSTDSCGDIICPGSHVLYTCTFPIRGSVIVVWRMKPECELNIRDIIFIRGTDNQLNTMCDDRRTIEVQGMDTPNGTVFVSTLNVTNITSSQTVECIFDDGSTEESIGNSTVFTTAPAQSAEITAVTPNVVLTLNQAINCPLIEYVVNSSTNCGMCGIVIDDTITCNNALMGSKCTVVVETKLCGIPVNQTVMTFDVTQRPITLSTTPASTQEAGSLSSGVVAVIIIVSLILLAVIVVIVVICIIVYVKGKKSKDTSYGIFRKRTKKGDIEQTENVSLELCQSEGRSSDVLLTNKQDSGAEGKIGTDENQSKVTNSAESAESTVDRPESVKDKSDRSDEVSTPVADSLKDTAATDNKSKVDRPENVQDKSDQSDEVMTPVADLLKNTAATDNKVHLTVQHLHGSNSGNISTAYETSTDGPGLIVTGSATMKSASAASSTKTSESSTYVCYKPPTTSYTRSSETQIFSSPLGEVDHNPAQQETGGSRDLSFNTDQEQLIQRFTQVVRFEGEKTRGKIDELNRKICTLEITIEENNKEIQRLQTLIDQMKVKDVKKTARIQQLENQIKELTAEKKETIKELNQLAKRK